jgi:hypothetical protein
MCLFGQVRELKSDLYRELLPLLNSGRVELLEHERLVAQLCGLERRTARSGRDSIDHAPGAHDDIANAVAGVLVRVAGKPGLETWFRFAGLVDSPTDAQPCPIVGRAAMMTILGL